jgi:putative FmdB family regulatory protein
MPLYEYECTECEARVEVLQRLSDPPLETCSTCGGSLTKLLSAPAFQFKGSGWYVTDYGSKKEASSNGGDGKTTKGESKSDASSTKETAPVKPKSEEKTPAASKSSTSPGT